VFQLKKIGWFKHLQGVIRILEANLKECFVLSDLCWNIAVICAKKWLLVPAWLVFVFYHPNKLSIVIIIFFRLYWLQFCSCSLF